MLAHLARQVSQHLMAFRDLDLECGVAHALNDGSFNGDHIFFWNNITSFQFCGAGTGPAPIIFALQAKTRNSLSPGAVRSE
jgi:hypothetical protein